jgi:hypothetical protein
MARQAHRAGIFPADILCAYDLHPPRVSQFLVLSSVGGSWDTPVTCGSWILGCEEDSIDRSCTVLVGVIRRCLPAPPHRAR